MQVHQRARGLLAERRHGLAGQVVRPEEVAVVATHGGQESDPRAAQPAHHEADDLGARPVQPRQVVDDEQHRGLRGDPAQQHQHGGGDNEPVGCLALPQPESDLQRVAVRLAEFVDARQHGEQQLVERGEAQLRLELAARGAQDDQPALRRGGRGGVQQGGLAQARVAGEQERAAPGGDLVEEAGQLVQFAVAADQGWG